MPNPPDPTPSKAFTFLGLNSASFKKAANYESVCVQRVQTGLLQRLLDSSCPQSELGVLGQQLETGAPTLLFTHVPDLKGPFGQQPAWDLNQRTRQEWERGAQSPNVLGIFAGHFHDPTHSLYRNTGGLQALALDRHVAQRLTWPHRSPSKNQLGRQNTARGFLVVTANQRESATLRFSGLAAANRRATNCNPSASKG